MTEPKLAAIEIRPIEPGDKAALAAAVDESSDEAIYRRFLNPHGRLTAAELRYLTEVDHRDHEALIALDLAGVEGVGVARYVRIQNDARAQRSRSPCSNGGRAKGLERNWCTGWRTAPATRTSPSSPR